MYVCSPKSWVETYTVPIQYKTNHMANEVCFLLISQIIAETTHIFSANQQWCGDHSNLTFCLLQLFLTCCWVALSDCKLWCIDLNFLPFYRMSWFGKRILRVHYFSLLGWDRLKTNSRPCFLLYKPVCDPVTLCHTASYTLFFLTFTSSFLHKILTLLPY